MLLPTLEAGELRPTKWRSKCLKQDGQKPKNELTSFPLDSRIYGWYEDLELLK